jgi:hypothetical protein
VKAAAAGKPPRRGHEQHRPVQGHATEKSRNEAEGSGHVAGGLGRDLVQGSEGKATLRKTTVESGHTKRKGLGRETLQPGQHAP